MFGISRGLSSIKREEPFSYYSIGFDAVKANNLAQRISHRSKEALQNIYYMFCNLGIAFANTLKLYKLEVESDPSFKTWQLANFVLHLPVFITNPIVMGGVKIMHLKETLGDRKLSIIRQIVLRNIPILSLLNCSWETYHIAKRTFASLIASKNIASKKPLKAVLYSLINAGNLIFSINNLYAEVNNHYMALLPLPYLKKYSEIYSQIPSGESEEERERLKQESNEVENDFKEFLEVHNLYRDEKCNDPVPSWSNNVERLTDQNLDTDCVNHAVTMLDPGMASHHSNICSSRRLADIHRARRKLQKEFHKDKGGDHEISTRINDAFETIKNRCFNYYERHAKYSLYNNFLEIFK